MRGSSGQSSEERRLGHPLHALAAVTALLAFLAFSSSAMASSAPVIESESVSGVSEHDATLEAQIETGGLYTGYQFEIDTNSSYNFTRFVCPFSFPGSAQCESIVDGEPLPAGLVEPYPQYIPAGSGDRSVSLDLASIGATLAPGTTYHYRVTASNGGQGAQGPDQTFTTPPAVASGQEPSIDSESASGITEHDAILEAKINPQGQAVRYQFQLVPNSSEYRSEVVCPPNPGPPFICTGEHVTNALPLGFIQSGLEDRPVSVDLASAGVTLQPGTTYHYRVIVVKSVQTEDTITWQGPPVYGPDQTFTTPPADTAPSIEGESVSDLTPSDATLEAQINTEGLETSYQFRLSSICGGRGACLVVINYPLPTNGVLLGSFVGQSVSLDLNRAGVTLQPGGTYFYSVSATSAAGTTEGPTQRFTTPEDTVQPLSTSTTTSPPSGASQPVGANNGGQPTGTGGSPAPGVAPLGPQIVCLCNCARGCHGKKVSPKHLTRTQKLANALKACKRKPKSKRAVCAKQARKAYATVAEKRKKG
jgi:hypothetical protein